MWLFMSLKYYLFAMIAVFVCVLAGTQVFFIYYAQQQMGQEVAQKSRTLSRQALQIVAQNLDKEQDTRSEPTFVAQDQGTGQHTLRITINSTPHKKVDLGSGMSFVTGDQTQTVSIVQTDPTFNLQFRDALIDTISTLDFRQIDGTHAFNVIGSSKTRGQQTWQERHIVQFDGTDSALKPYFDWLVIATLGLMILGLLLAYILANSLSRPLAALANGFKRLQGGELGFQVTPSGIADIRATLQHFNQMSARLAELQRVEKHLGQQQQLLELGEVARGLAHTLRNPINSIGLAVEELCNTELSTQTRGDLALSIRQKITHIDKTIKALLHLTTDDLQRNEQVLLNQIIEDVLLELSMLQQPNIVFSAGQLSALLAAPAEIRAIVHTLITNAIEASTQGQAIQIVTEQQEQTQCLIISDEGSGLDPSIASQLFKPHVTTKPEGAGMGLYIARRLCQLHYQGDISLRPNQSKGCIAVATFSCDPVRGKEGHTHE
jgi:signal transduction histidine kinase